MISDTEYQRVLPRDLFNESKLLKCVGRLILLIHDNQTPVTMSFDDSNCNEGFKVGLMEEGSMTIDNLSIMIDEEKYIFKTTYNSKSNYSLYVEHDYCEYLVFDEDGNFDIEFTSFCSDVLNIQNV